MKPNPNAVIDELRSRVAKLETSQQGMSQVINSLVMEIEAMKAKSPKKPK